MYFFPRSFTFINPQIYFVQKLTIQQIEVYPVTFLFDGLYYF